MEVNHRLNEYKRQARKRLTSKEGIQHRGKRCIEPEAVFGQIKYNMQYRRFRHFTKNKVTMDFAFFAIAFNIKKLCALLKKSRIRMDFTTITRINHLFRMKWKTDWKVFDENHSDLAA
jgi:hypothetical protein